MNKLSSAQIHNLLDAYCIKIGVKSAAVKKADEGDGLKAPTKGEQYKKDTADAKAQNPAGPESTSAKINEGQAQKDLGLHSRTVEEGVGILKPGTGMKDPGTTHPAKVGTEKYGAAELSGIGNEILADLAVFVSNAKMDIEKSAAEKLAADKAAAEKMEGNKIPNNVPSTTPAEGSNQPSPSGDDKDKKNAEVPAEKSAADQQAAKDAADLELGYRVGESVNTLLKQASADEQKYVEGMVAETIKRAAALAHSTCDYLDQFSKQAGDMDPTGASAGGPPPMAAGAPPAGGGDSGSGDDAAVQAVAQALVAEGITPEVLAQLTGQKGSGGDEDILSAAKQLVAEGVTPEMVHQLAQQSGQGGQGGGQGDPQGPLAGAPAPESQAGPDPKEVEKVAALIRSLVTRK